MRLGRWWRPRAGPRSRREYGGLAADVWEDESALCPVSWNGVFECIRPQMKKGSPEGYNAAEGDFPEPPQKPQTGEPNERQPLYRIRCTQEKRELLREDRRRADCRGRQAASDARRDRK